MLYTNDFPKKNLKCWQSRSRVSIEVWIFILSATELDFTSDEVGKGMVLHGTKCGFDKVKLKIFESCTLFTKFLLKSYPISFLSPQVKSKWAGRCSKFLYLNDETSNLLIKFYNDNSLTRCTDFLVGSIWSKIILSSN